MNRIARWRSPRRRRMNCGRPAVGRAPSVARSSSRPTRFIGAWHKSAAQCVEKAVTVERGAVAAHYSWILGQAILEQGNCRSLLGDSGAAHKDMARALVLVRGAGYGDLELRAAGILANAQTTAGNLLAKLGAWGERVWRNSGAAPLPVCALSRSTLTWYGRLRAWVLAGRHTCSKGRLPSLSARLRAAVPRPQSGRILPSWR